LQPGSAAYRIAALQAREQWVGELVEHADAALSSGDLATAERVYREALSVAGGHSRAQAGLAAVARRRKHDELLAQAQMAMKQKVWPSAIAAVRPILVEEPQHDAAVAVKRQAEAAIAQAAAASAPGGTRLRQTVTLELRDAPLRSAFDIISRTTGIDFVFDRDVRFDQRATLTLRDAPIELALTTLLAAHQLEHKVLSARAMLIYPATPAKQKEHQRLIVRGFYLVNAEAKSMAATLKSLLKLRDVAVDEKLNVVTVRDAADAVRAAEQLVALHDVAEPEVMLDVEVLEVKRTTLMELGVRWPEQIGLAPLASATTGNLTLADLRNLNSGSLSVGIGSATLNARRQGGYANLLANPRIRARNREKARIHIGERVPNITTTSTSSGFVAETVNYVDVGLKLDVEPTIHLDREVAIKVSLEVSNIITQIQTKSGTLAYQIGTRTASTTLRLRDGENQVLAGLISDEDRRSHSGLPGLGDVPLVGRLFGSQTDDNAKTEVVLSITPRIVRAVRRPESSVLEFDSGTELGAAVGLQVDRTGPSVTSEPQPQVPMTTDAPQQARSLPESPPRDAVPTESLRWSGPTSVARGGDLLVQLAIPGGPGKPTGALMIFHDPAVLEFVSVLAAAGQPVGEGVSGAVASGPPGVVTLTAGGSAGAYSIRFRRRPDEARGPGQTNIRAVLASGQQTAVQLQADHHVALPD
jgi:general secretion pathway protein D